MRLTNLVRGGMHGCRAPPAPSPSRSRPPARSPRRPRPVSAPQGGPRAAPRLVLPGTARKGGRAAVGGRLSRVRHQGGWARNGAGTTREHDRSSPDVGGRRESRGHHPNRADRARSSRARAARVGAARGSHRATGAVFSEPAAATTSAPLSPAAGGQPVTTFAWRHAAADIGGERRPRAAGHPAAPPTSCPCDAPGGVRQVLERFPTLAFACLRCGRRHDAGDSAGRP